LYEYRTSTHWCWNRADDRVYDVAVDWDVIVDDILWSWEGQVKKWTYFYEWASPPAPRSGYYHRRKGHLQNCVGPVCGNNYPVNILRSHSNGTWTWDTSD
jgi:hypothetical protein